MNERIGIIAAMDEEMREIEKIMQDKKEEMCWNLTFFLGKIGEKSCVLVKCGVGKVNAARTTQILIDNYHVTTVINVGSAGALKKEINYGDIVIGEKLVQYDFDITAFGHPKGYISSTGRFFKSDLLLVKKSNKMIEKIGENSYHAKIGVIATGDTFFTNKNPNQKIVKEFNADCVEMEGAAIAQVCYLDNIPFLIIRSISDVPNGRNEIDFYEYLEMASRRCAIFIQALLEE